MVNGTFHLLTVDGGQKVWSGCIEIMNHALMEGECRVTELWLDCEIRGRPLIEAQVYRPKLECCHTV
jgi:hypothetical protein